MIVKLISFSYASMELHYLKVNKLKLFFMQEEEMSFKIEDIEN